MNSKLIRLVGMLALLVTGGVAVSGLEMSQNSERRSWK